MKSRMILIVISAVVALLASYLWVASFSIVHVWQFALPRHEVNVTLYKGAIYFEGNSAHKDRWFAVDHLKRFIHDPVLRKFRSVNYYGGIGFGMPWMNDWIIALPIWAVLILTALLAIVITAVYRGIAKHRTRNRKKHPPPSGFEAGKS